MKLLAFTLLLAALLPAQAQQSSPLPKTINLFNNATKELLGTATISGKRIYFRDTKGEHYATVEINSDGTRSYFDPSGKPILNPTVPEVATPK